MNNVTIAHSLLRNEELSIWAGFPVKYMVCDFWNGEGPVVLFMAGKHRVELSLEDFPIDFSHARKWTDLLDAGIKALQTKVHGYNDFQHAIGVMAEETNGHLDC